MASIFASFRASITILKPSRSVSSRTSIIPSTCLSARISSIFLTIFALLTSYGISVMTMFTLLPLVSSLDTRLRTTTRPRPVVYAFLSSFLPWIIPPVGKSGPFTISRSSSMDTVGLSMTFNVASMTSPKLCGGISVA